MRYLGTTIAALWLVLTLIAPTTIALTCKPGWPSETNNYEAPKPRNGTHVARNPLSLLKLSEGTVERFDLDDSHDSKEDPIAIQRRADLGNCCRPTWECFYMLDEGDVVREGTEDWEKDRCCKLRYTQSCNDPQDVNEGLWWRPPPECSNKDVVGRDPIEFTVSYSVKPVTLAPITIGV